VRVLPVLRLHLRRQPHRGRQRPRRAVRLPACFVQRSLYLRCSLCGQTKWASTPERATYLLAFHLNRRHKGWTKATEGDS
jgi:hypothetical protein